MLTTFEVLAQPIRRSILDRLGDGECLVGELADALGLTQPLTSKHLRILNPTIRNALATALHARSNYHHCRSARAYLEFQALLVPDYWEPAELLPGYVDDWQVLSARDDGYERPCRRCGRSIVNSARDKWTHLAADGTLGVGCRVASFTADAGWDETVDRRWKATPS